MSWQMSEEKAYKWFKTNIDQNAEMIGGENSIKADIYSPLYDAYIEVKDITNEARSGQFTESTIANNPFAQAIYNGKYDSLICKDFVKYHYNKKNVAYFIIIDNDEISFYSFEDFLILILLKFKHLIKNVVAQDKPQKRILHFFYN